METIARTGVEMEALTAVRVAALNVYDMVKGIDKGVVVEAIRLLEKTKGGAVTGPALRVAVITVSDRSAAGEREDRSGPGARRGRRGRRGPRWCGRDVVPDDQHGLTALLRRLCDAADSPDLILTTGGTGVGPRDRTPEATRAACQRMVPGIAETLRAGPWPSTPTRCSRAGRPACGVRTLVVTCPARRAGRGTAGGWSRRWRPTRRPSCRGGDHPGGSPGAVGAPRPAE